MATVFLHPGKERAARQRHPWIFSGAVERVQGYVDRYAESLLAQVLTQAMAARAEPIGSLLAELVGARGIYERSDAEVRQKEDLPPAEGLLWGEAPPETIAVEQVGGRFLTDIRAGQ